jgi:hypothetical protein
MHSHRDGGNEILFRRIISKESKSLELWSPVFCHTIALNRKRLHSAIDYKTPNEV